MKTREALPAGTSGSDSPDEAELAALRSWYAGLDARAAVAHYLGDRRALGASSRGVLGRIRRQLIAYAQDRHRSDLVAAFANRPTRASANGVARAIETLRNVPVAHGILTLADLTVRIPRRRRW